MMASDTSEALRLDSSIVIVAGKGGVGSSTIATATALAAARRGAEVLYVPVDGRESAGRLLGADRITDADRILRSVDGGGVIRARTISADQAFGDYLDLKGVGAILRRAASAASLPMIAAATPGLEHLLVLGKIKELEREGAADLIIVDAPPAGHATPFLQAASGLSDVITSGPVLEQADEVAAMLRDPNRCSTVVVALPESTPVTEAIELAADLDELDIARTAPVLNAAWPDRLGLDRSPGMAGRGRQPKLSDGVKSALSVSVDFGRERLAVQRDQKRRLSDALGAPVVVPRRPTATLDVDDLEAIADALEGKRA